MKKVEEPTVLWHQGTGNVICTQRGQRQGRGYKTGPLDFFMIFLPPCTS